MVDWIKILRRQPLASITVQMHGELDTADKCYLWRLQCIYSFPKSTKEAFSVILSKHITYYGSGLRFLFETWQSSSVPIHVLVYYYLNIVATSVSSTTINFISGQGDSDARKCLCLWLSFFVWSRTEIGNQWLDFLTAKCFTQMHVTIIMRVSDPHKMSLWNIFVYTGI